jgi:8-oxo-dGTP pyrophosphatase MutT (NUDIX family)
MFVLRRQAARVVLVDDLGQMLLITAHDPRKPSEPSWLELPGGGIDPGEPSTATCLRELREEVGIVDAILGPVLWTQRCRFEFGGFRFDQTEVIHVARCAPDPVRHSTALESLEVLAFEHADWYTAEKLQANEQRTLPPRLRELIGPVVELSKLSIEQLSVEWPSIDSVDITNPEDWTW